MNLRVLSYFLTVAREESILGAANALHVTQPTLSRQMRELEEEVGKVLFIRGPRKITLTADGIYLRQRASEILAMVEKTEQELSSSSDHIIGELYIGVPEMDAMRYVARAIERTREQHPGIHFHVYGGDGILLASQIESGFLDFAMQLEPVDLQKCGFLRFPKDAQIGLMLRSDSPLAQKKSIRPGDLRDEPLIMPRQFLEQNYFSKWVGISVEELNIVATNDLPYDSMIMVLEGLGHVVSINFGLVMGERADSLICFRPLEPMLSAGIFLTWKKNQVFSRAAEVFLSCMREVLEK